jgi:hypothetical protein
MCYDQRSSFIAWFVGFVSGLLLFFRNQGNDRWISMFILTFTGMQFIEFKLWRSIDYDKPEQNSKWTKIALLNVWGQAFVMSLGAMMWGKAAANHKWLYTVMKLVFALVVLFSIDAFKRTLDTSLNFKSFVGPNGHLVWTQDYNPNIKSQHNFYIVNKRFSRFAQLIYVLGIFLPYLFMSQTTRAIWLFGTVFTTMLYNYINYYHTGEFSSMWCYHGVIYSLIAWLRF